MTCHEFCKPWARLPGRRYGRLGAPGPPGEPRRRCAQEVTGRQPGSVAAPGGEGAGPFRQVALRSCHFQAPDVGSHGARLSARHGSGHHRIQTIRLDDVRIRAPGGPVTGVPCGRGRRTAAGRNSQHTVEQSRLNDVSQTWEHLKAGAAAQARRHALTTPALQFPTVLASDRPSAVLNATVRSVPKIFSNRPWCHLTSTDGVSRPGESPEYSHDVSPSRRRVSEGTGSCSGEGPRLDDGSL
jgi:hypothetical protein